MLNNIFSTHPVYIVDGLRTPFLKAESKPGPFSAADLGVFATRALLMRQVFTPDVIDELIVGCVLPSPDEANIGRIISLRSGLPEKIPAWTVMRNCASGMQALDSAAINIASGRSDLVIAGGVEAMSHAPLLFSHDMVNFLADFTRSKGLAKLKAFLKFRPHYLNPVIALLRGLCDPIVGLNMGQTAEKLDFQFNISRTEMDEFAYHSQIKLAKAVDNNNLTEIMPIYDSLGNLYSADNGLRRDSTIEKLAKLKPVFDKPYGKVTAGNSSQVTDGAAMLLLASGNAVEKYKLNPLARIVDVNWAGLDPSIMGLGPVYASTPILTRNALKLDDINYWEINEAFAAQVLACANAWENQVFCKNELGLSGALGKLDPEKLNIDGGAIALGHPIGASGARIVLHLAEILKRTNSRLGIATLCIGGGQGGAMLIERI